MYVHYTMSSGVASDRLPRQSEDTMTINSSGVGQRTSLHVIV